MLMDLNIYVANMELHGILIFSSEERPALEKPGGAVIATKHFIHNYPLIYGFNNRNVEAYTVIPSLHFLTYGKIRESRFVPRLAKKPLKYTFITEEIKKLLEGKDSIYAYPATPLKVTVKKIFMQAKGFGYAEFRGRLKTVYPRLEHYIAVTPPSLFRTIVISYRELPRIMYVRIGMKRMGLFKTYLNKARIVKKVGTYEWTSIPVNLYDMTLFGYEVYDFIKIYEKHSKPPLKPQSSIIGYVKTKDLYEILTERGERLRVPLPQKRCA